MATGRCQLCGQLRTRVDSHIWSKFGYKRYASEKGGQFFDMRTVELNFRQVTRPWFCHDCEQIMAKTENHASRLCSKIDADPTQPRAYDARLLPFAVSISFRTALYDIERTGVAPPKKLSDAIRRWKQFLLGKRAIVAPFTQHLFVVVDKQHALHKGLGGQIYADNSLVHSHIGPMYIVGLFDRRRLTLPELTIWDRSEIKAGGGIVEPIAEWRTAIHTSGTANITYEMVLLLFRRLRQAVKLVSDARKEDEAKGRGLRRFGVKATEAKGN